MSIVLDPSANFITVQIWYIEEKTKHGHERFHFINGADDVEKWKGRGYLTQDEFEQKMNESPPGKTAPGMPVKPQADPNKIIKILKTWWTRLSWKDQNTIYSQCLKHTAAQDGTTRVELDGIAFRDLKLKTCLKKWDFIANGKELPITSAVIDNLVPEVAQELLNSFEKVTEATEEELGE